MSLIVNCYQNIKQNKKNYCCKLLACKSTVLLFTLNTLNIHSNTLNLVTIMICINRVVPEWIIALKINSYNLWCSPQEIAKRPTSFWLCLTGVKRSPVKTTTTSHWIMAPFHGLSVGQFQLGPRCTKWGRDPQSARGTGTTQTPLTPHCLTLTALQHLVEQWMVFIDTHSNNLLQPPQSRITPAIITET